ncbi:MAG: nucleoside triphosphate pyrophosphohydrolase family protein [Crocinitomicaceae bacterium]|nr:nucleoside triphosphate pyrophosphohydrolase family protein [Crocinitomicaceae bacterium]
MNDELTLHQTICYVQEFHRAFGLPVRPAPTAKLDKEEVALRFNLMKEENEEYLEAARKGDIIEIADALGDMLYVLCGTINAHGLQNKMAQVFEEIQRSNMSKLDENGNPIHREDGKVIKSDRYFRPDLAAVLGIESK